MVEENKFEMIEYLTNELAKECEKQGLTHIVAINVDEDRVLSGGNGNIGEMIECITHLEQEVEKRVGLSFDFIQTVTMSKDESNCQRCKSHQEDLKETEGDLVMDFLDKLFKVATQGGTSR